MIRVAAALPRFSSDWDAPARPLVTQRATRLFHICAAVIALGYITGLLVRGHVLRDEDGLGSSFFGARVVRVLS